MEQVSFDPRPLARSAAEAATYKTRGDRGKGGGAAGAVVHETNPTPRPDDADAAFRSIV